MDSSGTQPLARQAEFGGADSGTVQGGSRCPDIGEDLLGGGTIGTAIRVRDMGTDNAYEEGDERIPP